MKIHEQIQKMEEILSKIDLQTWNLKTETDMDCDFDTKKTFLIHDGKTKNSLSDLNEDEIQFLKTAPQDMRSLIDCLKTLL